MVNAQAEELLEIQGASDTYMNYLDQYVKKDYAFSRRMEQDPDTWEVEEAATRHRTRKQEARVAE